tara:strand:- start:2764 stop:3681 length:918 start_codon:yes stop_codon:yes gene_type:complete
MDKIKLPNYSLIKELGKGAFGVVYKAMNKKNNTYVAIKVEKKDTNSRLKNEVAIYNKIQKKKSNKGFPVIYELINMKNKIIIVMDILGPSLEDLYDFCNKSFSIKTVLMIGIQILNRIEVLHKIGYIHRDIKPDNFLIGSKDKKSRIFMIDLGLAKKYVNKKTHIEYRTDKNFTGSFRYSSIRNHKGIEQSRRDDLESIGYMLLYFLKKKLPWQGLKGSTKKKRSINIYNVKSSVSLEDLCADVPREFFLYMKYCRFLHFKMEPNYDLLKNLFITLFKKNNYKLDFVYDWNIVAKKKKAEYNSKT